MPAKSTSAVSNLFDTCSDGTYGLLAQDYLKARIPDLQIVIVGAGIGGLAAAVGLNRAGFTNIVIHESAKEIAEASAHRLYRILSNLAACV